VTAAPPPACIALRTAVPAALADELAPTLWLLSPNGVQIEDAMCLGGGDVAAGWLRVIAYVAPGEAEEAAAAITSAARDAGVAVEVERQAIADEDWNRVWKQHFRPLVVAGRVRVEPPWLAEPEANGSLRIIVDPGMAFGTGTHETTQLCIAAILAWADSAAATDRAIGGRTVLDVGTGSAILAILAARLGVRQVVATEIDRAAVDSAALNLRLNGVADRVTLVHTGDLGSLGAARHDLVVANILAPVIDALCDGLCARVADGGRLILSGILVRQADAITARFTAGGLRWRATDRRGDWAAIALDR